MLTIQPNAPFSNTLTLTTLSYKIMKVYSLAGKHLLLGTTQSAPVTRAMTRIQFTQKYNRTLTLTRQPRQRIQAIYKCCGISGHDYVQQDMTT